MVSLIEYPIIVRRAAIKIEVIFKCVAPKNKNTIRTSCIRAIIAATAQLNLNIIDTYIKTTKSKIFRYDVNEIYETLSKSHDHNKLNNL